MAEDVLSTHHPPKDPQENPPRQESPFGMKLLVITPTLGDSPFLPASIESVRPLRERVEVRHVLATPAAAVDRLAALYADCEVIADAGRDGGMYGAINRALFSTSDWDWFTYINDDDLLMPGIAKVAVTHCQPANRRVIAYGDVRNVREDETSLGLQTVERSPRYFCPLLRQRISVFTQQGALVSREVAGQLEGFNPAWRVCGDLDFWVRAIAAGFAFKYYPSEVARFRIRSGQLSGDTALLLEEWGRIVRPIESGRVSPVQLVWARWRFRMMNASRYLERIRATGWVRSHHFTAAREER